MIPPNPDELAVQLKIFKRSHPWTGDLEERKLKFINLHNQLCLIFNKEVRLDLSRARDGYSSERSYTTPSRDLIVLDGKLSVITFLHEWGHILGASQEESQTWALALYKLTFPKNYAKLSLDRNRFATMEGPE